MPTTLSPSFSFFIFAVFCLIFCSPDFVTAGAYEPYLFNSTCVPVSSLNATLGPCYPIIAPLYTHVYSDANDPIRTALFSLQLAPSGLTDHACNTATLVMFCMTRWRGCVPVDIPASVLNTTTDVTVSVARPVCHKVCDNWVTACSTTANNVPTGTYEKWQVLNCTVLFPILWTINMVEPFAYPDNPDVPLYLQDAMGNNVTYDVNLTCIYVDATNLTVTTAAYCPEPLIKDPDTGFCTVQCPLPLISDDDYTTLEITMSVLGWISFVLTTVLIATYLLDPQRRSYPAVLPLFFIFCTNATSFAFCLGSMVGHRDVWCDGKKPNDFGGGACTVQGIIWVYFTLAAVLWWLMIVINLLVMLVVPNAPKVLARWHYLYHIVWLVPVITLIISLSAQKLGYGGDVWCSVHIGDPKVSFIQKGTEIVADYNEDEYLWNLLLIVVPILVMVGLGILIVLAVLIYMLVQWKHFGLKYLLLQWRLFAFTFFYIYIYTFLFAFEIERIVQTDDQYKAFLDWISCSVIAYGLAQAGTGYLNCDLEQKVSFPLWYIVVFNASVQGIVIFLIFGTSWRMYKGWYNLFRHPKLVWRPSSATASGPSVSGSNKVEGRNLSGSTRSAGRNDSEMMNSLSSDEEQEEEEEEESGESEEMTSSASSSSTSSDFETDYRLSPKKKKEEDEDSEAIEMD